MIFVFAGTDSHKRQEALAELLERSTDRELLSFDPESFDAGLASQAISGGDIFSRSYLAVLRDLLPSDHGDFVRGNIPAMQDSETIFVIVEDALGKKDTELLKAAAKTFKTFDLPKAADHKFNIFSVTDAFGARDKKSTWVLFQKALRSGVAPEEVLNILIWQAKNLLLVQNAKSAAETGLAPFVYQKSKSYSLNFKEEELKDISRNLTALFHESHLGLDLGPNLELFLLKTL